MSLCQGDPVRSPTRPPLGLLVRRGQTRSSRLCSCLSHTLDPVPTLQRFLKVSSKRSPRSRSASPAASDPLAASRVRLHGNPAVIWALSLGASPRGPNFSGWAAPRPRIGSLQQACSPLPGSWSSSLDFCALPLTTRPRSAAGACGRRRSWQGPRPLGPPQTHSFAAPRRGPRPWPLTPARWGVCRQGHPAAALRGGGNVKRAWVCGALHSPDLRAAVRTQGGSPPTGLGPPGPPFLTRGPAVAAWCCFLTSLSFCKLQECCKPTQRTGLTLPAV